MPAVLISSMTFFNRSSNSPRYLVPATRAPMSRVTRRLPCRVSGTSPLLISWARASTMAVLPTPGSPTRTGLFLVRRLRIWTIRSISFSRPMTGSNLSALAAMVRSMPSWSRVGVLEVDRLPWEPVPEVWLSMRWVSARTLSRVTPRLSRTPAATPSPSRSSPMRRCSVPIYVWFMRRASSTANSTTFFARGVRPISPWAGFSPRPMMNSTADRTLLRSTDRLESTRAATPSVSRTRPRRMCSVPM